MTWGGGGTPAGGQGAAFETAFSTAGPKQISATWRTNKNATATAQVPIMVVENFGIPPEASSIAYLGPLPLTPNSAPGGITRVGFPDLNFETYLDCATQSWRIKVTQAVSETFMGVSMGTRQELTPFTILSTFSCSELEIMESDFYEGSHCCPSSSEKYYMESAIRAHEELHMSNMKTILADSYRIFLGRVASIAEPISGYQTKEAALLGMTGGSDFGAALLGLVQDYNTSTQHEASHGDAQTFTDAERRVLYPNLRLIQERKSTLNCP